MYKPPPISPPSITLLSTIMLAVVVGLLALTGLCRAQVLEPILGCTILDISVDQGFCYTYFGYRNSYTTIKRISADSPENSALEFNCAWSPQLCYDDNRGQETTFKVGTFHDTFMFKWRCSGSLASSGVVRSLTSGTVTRSISLTQAQATHRDATRCPCSLAVNGTLGNCIKPPTTSHTPTATPSAGTSVALAECEATVQNLNLIATSQRDMIDELHDRIAHLVEENTNIATSPCSHHGRLAASSAANGDPLRCDCSVGFTGDRCQQCSSPPAGRTIVCVAARPDQWQRTIMLDANVAACLDKSFATCSRGDVVAQPNTLPSTTVSYYPNPTSTLQIEVTLDCGCVAIDSIRSTAAPK